MAEVLLRMIVKLLAFTAWPQSEGFHKLRSELLAEADGASLPAGAQAEVAQAPRRHLPVDPAGGKESRKMFIPFSQYNFAHLCGEADPHS
jgi:hypothetical protein